MSRPDFHDLLRVVAFWMLTFGSAMAQAEEPVQTEASQPSESLSLVPEPLLSPDPNPTPLPDGTMPQPLPVMPTPVLPESRALSEELDKPIPAPSQLPEPLLNPEEATPPQSEE